MDSGEGVIQSEENRNRRFPEDSMAIGILRVGSNRCSRSRSFNGSLPTMQSKNPSERPSVTFNLSEENHRIEKRKKVLNEDHSSTGTPRDMSGSLINSDNAFEEEKIETPASGTETDGDEDYSVSVNAMLQRKSSSRRFSRRKKRRGSSPFLVEEGLDSLNGLPRRRSSVFTTSSGDTAISMDVGMEDDEGETMKEKEIFEKLRLHKEVLGAAKHQPWPLRKKVRLVRQAKSYIRRHEGALQERLAQSRTTKDVLAQASIFINNKWKYFKREVVNLQTWVIPWEVRIKEIESHFGSAVASYFVFLRWLFWINLVIAIVLTAFVAVPEIFTADKTLAGDRKIMLPGEIAKSKHFLTLWEFEGVLKHSPFFYGWYTNWDPSNAGYRLPLAYFVVMLIVYTYSFVAILRKMAENSRMSKLSEKEDECAFSWKLFTAWDFMIGNPETAHNKIASIVLGFKESLLEEAEKEKKLGQWKIRTVRVLVNLTVLLLLAFSVWAVVNIVNNSAELEAQTSWWQQNAITIVMSLISFIFPIFFEILGLLENYHPRKTLRIQLGRIMILNLLNLYSLIFALFAKISDMEQELEALKPKDPSSNSFSIKNLNSSLCRNMWVLCSELSIPGSVSDQKFTTTFASMTLPTTSTSKTTLMTMMAALSLITVPPTSSVPKNVFESRLNDAPAELRMGFDDSDDYGNLGPSSSYGYSVPTSDSIVLTPSMPRFDDNIKWEQYPGQDDPFLNYDNYDAVNISYGSRESSSFSPATMDNETSNSMNSTEIWIDEETLPNSYEMSTESVVSMNTIMESSSVESENHFVTENIGKKVDLPVIQQKVNFSKSNDVKNNTKNMNLPDINGRKNNTKCLLRICDVFHDPSTKTSRRVSLSAMKRLNMTTKRKLRRLCWETMFGQELAKLTVMDLVLTVIGTLGVDFFRAIFVRYTNSWWCWDLEKQFPQYGDFKIAENILHLVNNQGLVWMGMFFSPGLTILNVIKLGIFMYLRAWAVMTCNVPHEVVFRASRSNNFYLALLLTMLFLCVIPVGYAVTWVEPSWHCGPFSGYYRIYYMATESLKDTLPDKVRKGLDYVASPGIVIPLIVLMVLIIYYMISLAGSLREANNDLKIQLRHERTEERRKMFKIASKRGQSIETPFSKWKKILPPASNNTSPKPADLSISNVIGNILQERRQRAFERLRSTSEAEETNIFDPSSLQIPEPLSLSPIIQDNEQSFFPDDKPADDSNEIPTGSNIPTICIDQVELDAVFNGNVDTLYNNEHDEEIEATNK